MWHLLEYTLPEVRGFPQTCVLYCAYPSVLHMVGPSEVLVEFKDKKLGYPVSIKLSCGKVKSIKNTENTERFIWIEREMGGGC